MNAIEVETDPAVRAAEDEQDQRGWSVTETTVVAQRDGVLLSVVLTLTVGDPDALLDIVRHEVGKDVRAVDEYLIEGLAIPAAEVDLLLSCFGKLVASQVPTATAATEASRLEV